MADPAEIDAILEAGAARARKEAREVLARARDQVGSGRRFGDPS